MRVMRLPLEEAQGHLLLHNVVDADGRHLLRKGIRLGPDTLERLRELGHTHVEVAILEPQDVWEDEAARELARALERPELTLSWGVGGRVNLYTVVHGVLYVDAPRLEALNRLPGITLATAPQHAIVHPQRGENRIATLKIIPYAIPRPRLQQALALAQEPRPLLEVRPLTPQRWALLVIGDPAAHVRLRRQFEPPTRERLLRLNSELSTVVAVPLDEGSVAQAAAELLQAHHGLVLVGQTSIMDPADLPLRGLQAIGARVTVYGAPVDPGNLLAVAYLGDTPILCAPGCARSLGHNVVDLVLPRLLTGDRLDQAQIAALGLGGLLQR